MIKNRPANIVDIESPHVLRLMETAIRILVSRLGLNDFASTGLNGLRQDIFSGSISFGDHERWEKYISFTSPEQPLFRTRAWLQNARNHNTQP